MQFTEPQIAGPDLPVGGDRNSKSTTKLWSVGHRVAPLEPAVGVKGLAQGHVNDRGGGKALLYYGLSRRPPGHMLAFLRQQF